MPSRRIDIIVLPKPYVVEPLLEGIHQHGQANRWRLVVRYAWEPQLARRLKSSPADGFITLDDEPSVLRALAATPKPKIGIRLAKPVKGMPSVAPDDRAVGRLAAEHLIAEGYTRFAFLGLNLDYSLLRRDGFVSALSDRGYTCIDNRREMGRPRPRFPRYDELNRPEVIEKWVQSLPFPIAIMACSDEFGSQVIDACDRLGIDVPAKCAVIGADNNELRCEFSPTTMTSVDVDLHSAGLRGALLLERAFRGERPESDLVEMIQPAGVVPRRSTEWLSGHDAELDKALTMIRSQAAAGITIDDVLAEVPISRTALEQRFKKQLGRTPGEELRRVRLNLAVQLLEQTDLSVMEVAMRSGYSSSAYLCQAFRQQKGVSPSRYRAAYAER